MPAVVEPTTDSVDRGMVFKEPKAKTTEVHDIINGNHRDESDERSTGVSHVEHCESEMLEPMAATDAYRMKHPLAYDLSKLPFLEPRPLKMIVAGAGVSALSLAHEVAIGALKNVELVILEKNAGLGGTWFENRYPGCACDIPSHNYLFTWAPNPNWSSYYVTAPEILKYLEDTADKFDLRKYITLGRKVIGARWLEDQQKWQITSRRSDGRRNVVSSYGITDGETGDDIVEQCDVFVNASGFFNHWRWPTIPWRDHYQGVLAHSANYDPRVDLRGKRVAVIGNGSSGIQVTTAMQKIASEVSVFVRNPTYVTASMGSKYFPNQGESLLFTDEQKRKWVQDPDEYLRYRKAVEFELNIRFPTFIRESPQQKMAMQVTLKDMKDKLADKPELVSLLIPTTFAVGCRRPTPGTGYLEALCAPNCDVVWGELDSFTETGLRSADGRERNFDAIICATGFDLSFVPRWPIIGENGINLREAWSEDPACYMSCIASDMPNYFVYLGPGSPVGHGSLITAIDRITLYICDMVTKLQTQNYNAFVLKSGKAKAYQAQMFAWLEKTVWGDNCQSSFKNGTVGGALHAFHPGSRLHYFEVLRARRYEDFEWTSKCPEPELDFAWFNNGFLAHEMDSSDPTDTTWYLNEGSQAVAY